jgi:hypothetical protein
MKGNDLVNPTNNKIIVEYLKNKKYLDSQIGNDIITSDGTTLLYKYFIIIIKRSRFFLMKL